MLELVVFEKDVQKVSAGQKVTFSTPNDPGKTISDFEAIEVKKGATDQGFTEITLPAGFDLVNVKVVVKGAYSVLSAWKNAGEMAC